MQSLNSSQESCKDHISFIRNELFRSSKILLYQVSDSSSHGPRTSLTFYEESTGRRNYEAKEDESSHLVGPPKMPAKPTATTATATPLTPARGPKKPTENPDDDYIRATLNTGMCSLQSTEGALKYSVAGSCCSSSNSSGDLPKPSSTARGDDRMCKGPGVRRKKVGDIVSTSRSGHLIEKRDESYSSALKIPDPEPEGCDTNDNIINTDALNSEAYDINDNPSDDGNVQREEDTSLSENGQSGRSESETPCEIGLLERLIRSHPVWFLRGIQRAGAVHLLQGKEEGNFIVRQSSQRDTMAVSVRLPAGKGPYIEHYLIQRIDGQLSLESSENVFESIPSLIAHYCQCCDELPVRLSLPATIREAKNRQQLSSLALLGQEFWRYPMANPRPPESQNSSPNGNKSDSLGSSEGKRIHGKKSEEVVLDLTPLGSESQNSSLMSTFKRSPVEQEGNSPTGGEEARPKRPHTLDLVTTNFVADKTGLLNGNKTPPQPPPRWTKPTSFISSPDQIVRTNVTTPVFEEEASSGTQGKQFHPLFSMLSDYERNASSPQSDSTNLKSFQFKSENNCRKTFREENKLELISPVSDTTSLVSKSLEKAQQQQLQQQQPSTLDFARPDRVFKRCKKDGRRESAHYRESDILESPTLYYYKSNVADKQSDYEDIWATESLLTTFKPNGSSDQAPDHEDQSWKGGDMKKTPDLLEKLETSFRWSFKEGRKGRKGGKEGINKPEEGERGGAEDPGGSFDSQVTERFDAKQSSPFYAEPADALVVRRKEKASMNKARHSDPFSFNNWSIHMNPYFSGGNILGRIDSQNEVVSEEASWKTKPSLSFDNIMNLKKREVESGGKLKAGQKGGKGAVPMRGKPVRPPKIYNLPPGDRAGGQNWAVDSSWEFIGNETAEREGERRFPSIEQQMDSDEAAVYKDTVEEMIAKRFPHFKISRGVWSRSGVNRANSPFLQQIQLQKIESGKNGSRMSAYDNLTCDRFAVFKGGNGDSLDRSSSADGNSDEPATPPTGIQDPSDPVEVGSYPLARIPVLSDTLRHKRRVECGSLNEDNEDAQTIFSEPWDSSRWEHLLPGSEDSSKNSVEGSHQGEAVFVGDNTGGEVNRYPGKTGKKKTGEGMDLSTPFQHTTSRSRELSATGASIRSYALHLASDKSTTFAQNIDNFIECTLESKEANPQVVMRNMRQFMSGMKNYLVKHGEREFEKQVEEERMKLKSTEFLNLDSILEGVMHKLVVRPLREHLYKLFVDEYVRNGAIQVLYENLNYAKTKSLRDLGLKSNISPPSQDALERICHFITKLQEVDSPLEKLDHLLASVSTIIYSVKHANQGKTGIALGADDILPLFIWVLIQSGFIAAEIEAEYMWGLLHPSLLSGEGCYYLTTLSSAVHVLKNLKSCDLEQSNRSTLNEWRCGDLKSVLKIIVPDELHGSILTKTLPVKPNMTTKDVCKIIAHKIRITNPQDYGLFRLVDGEETLLNDTDCPQDVKCQFLESGKHCTLAYKRIDAKIGWPRTT